MVDDLARLDDVAKSVSGVGREPTTAELNVAARANSRNGPLLDFDKNALAEANNVTLQGEDKIADALTRAWNGQNHARARQANDNYRDCFVRLLDPQTKGIARTDAYAALVRLSPQVRTQAQRVIKLNLENMTPVEGRIKDMSNGASHLMIALRRSAPLWRSC